MSDSPAFDAAQCSSECPPAELPDDAECRCGHTLEHHGAFFGKCHKCGCRHFEPREEE